MNDGYRASSLASSSVWRQAELQSYMSASTAKDPQKNQQETDRESPLEYLLACSVVFRPYASITLAVL